MTADPSGRGLRDARLRAIQYTLAALVLATLTVGFGVLPNGESLAFLSGVASLLALVGSVSTVQKAKADAGE